VLKELGQVAAHAEQELVAVSMWLALVDLDDSVYQPGIGSRQIGGAHWDHRMDWAILAGKPALLG
jgi:hypothetical protein